MSHKLSKDQISELLKRYELGESAGVLSKIFSITPTSIYALMKRREIARRSYSDASRKYTLNEAYFNEINTEHKAYFLGFLMADGYNNEPRGVVELGCAVKDREILEKLNVLIGSNKPIRTVDNKGKISCRIDWCSRKLSSDLVRYGCVKAKSLILEFPKLDAELVRHFIRGYFDGDGCISCSYSKKDNCFGNCFNSVCTITSTEKFCLYVKNYIKTNIDINSTVLCRHPEHNNTNRTLQIAGNLQVIKLMEWMYCDYSICLERKRQKFEDIKVIIANRRENLRIIRSAH